MEDLAPVFKCLLVVKSKLEQGESVRLALKQILTDDESEFNQRLNEWYLKISTNQSTKELIFSIKSIYQRTFLYLLESGLRGEPILQYLSQLEDEVKDASLQEIEQKITLIPFKILVPLLFLQFPALLILLFAPFLSQLLQSL